MPHINGYLDPGGRLRLVQWAEDVGIDRDNERDGVQQLAVSLAPRSTPMAHSTATGDGLVTNGFLGVDVIRLGAGEGFEPHVHPGDHLLIVIGGQGTITYAGKIYPTRAGQVYMIEGAVPHAVGAVTEHVILAVGAPHKAVDDRARMAPVEYQNVLTEIGDLHCLICDAHATHPLRLHDAGCPHCPCHTCVGVDE